MDTDRIQKVFVSILLLCISVFHFYNATAQHDWESFYLGLVWLTLLTVGLIFS